MGSRESAVSWVVTETCSSSFSPGVGKEIGKNRDSEKRGNDIHRKKCW